jgi:hypothetical protein
MRRQLIPLMCLKSHIIIRFSADNVGVLWTGGENARGREFALAEENLHWRRLDDSSPLDVFDVQTSASGAFALYSPACDEQRGRRGRTVRFSGHLLGGTMIPALAPGLRLRARLDGCRVDKIDSTGLCASSGIYSTVSPGGCDRSLVIVRTECAWYCEYLKAGISTTLRFARVSLSASPPDEEILWIDPFGR